MEMTSSLPISSLLVCYLDSSYLGNGMDNVVLFNDNKITAPPTLFLYGEEDGLIPPHLQYTLASAIFEPKSDPKLRRADGKIEEYKGIDENNRILVNL